MRELKLDVFSLYPDLNAPGPYDYAILVDQLDVGPFSCESYGAQVVNRTTGDCSQVPNITVSVTRIDHGLHHLQSHQGGRGRRFEPGEITYYFLSFMHQKQGRQENFLPSLLLEIIVYRRVVRNRPLIRPGCAGPPSPQGEGFIGGGP